MASRSQDWVRDSWCWQPLRHLSRLDRAGEQLALELEPLPPLERVSVPEPEREQVWEYSRALEQEPLRPSPQERPRSQELVPAEAAAWGLSYRLAPPQ